MTSLVNLLLLPLRAPMLLLLLLISTYLGLHWSRPGLLTDPQQASFTTLIWSAECLQALVVVVMCTVPDLLIRGIASMMAASRVASLVMTLLIVITSGLYLLHLEVLSNVLILASAVLLARLDLVRLRVVPPPFVMTLVLSVLVLGGLSLGRNLEASVRPWLAPPHASTAPAAHRSEEAAERGQAAGGEAPRRAPAMGSGAEPAAATPRGAAAAGSETAAAGATTTAARAPGQRGTEAAGEPPDKPMAADQAETRSQPAHGAGP